MSIVENAEKIALEAHRDHRRKWGGQLPYVTHLEWCVAKAKTLGYGEEEQAALWLHDLLEDIAYPTVTEAHWAGRIIKECGDKVLGLVRQMTNPSSTPVWKARNPAPHRADKWLADLDHIRMATYPAKRCKMVDRLHNVQTMDDAPSVIKARYVIESRELQAACQTADLDLARELETAIKVMEDSLAGDRK